MDILDTGNYSCSDHNVTGASFLYKSWVIRFVSGLSCAGSILGSSLIIFSYLCFRRLRTKVREILFHLSVADLGVAIANLIGAVVYFDQYYDLICDSRGDIIEIHLPSAAIQHLCTAQAFFALYFTLSSILWTMSLAGYLYFVLVHHGTQHAKMFLMFSYTFCYGMPLFVSLWPAVTERLGYSPYNSAGWCTVILVDPKTGERDIFMGVVGYDLWIYLALVLVTVLCVAMKTFLREEFQRTKEFVSKDRFWKSVYVLEYKLLSIPIAFFLLRMWTCIINMVYVYINVKNIPHWISITLIYLSGIGDSGQGLVNAILFVILTKQVRDSYLQFCCGKKFDARKEKNDSATSQEACAGVNIDESVPSIRSNPITPVND